MSIEQSESLYHKSENEKDQLDLLLLLLLARTRATMSTMAPIAAPRIFGSRLSMPVWWKREKREVGRMLDVVVLQCIIALYAVLHALQSVNRERAGYRAHPTCIESRPKPCTG